MSIDPDRLLDDVVFPDWAKNVPDPTDCPKCGRDSCDGTCDKESE
jgi:hypothetical protein